MKITDSVSMMYRSISILRCSILQRVGERKGDYGLDHVLYVHQKCDLVSYAKAVKKKKMYLIFPTPEFFWASFRCGFQNVGGLEIFLLKPGIPVLY